jgi:hypothetical protein
MSKLELEQIHADLTEVFGAEVASNPRVAAAALQAVVIERAATRLALALELVAASLAEPPAGEELLEPTTRPAGLIRPTGGAILR